MNSTKPTIERPDEYISIDQPLVRQPTPCPFQLPCWQKIRAPIARRGFIGEDGKRHKIYMPYICSFADEGQIDLCSRYQKFKADEERDKINDTGLSTEGTITDNLSGSVHDTSD